MIKETNVTAEYLKAISRKFDADTIFVLNLQDRSKKYYIILLNKMTKQYNSTS